MIDALPPSDLNKVLETYRRVVLDGYTCPDQRQPRNYAVSNLRGGVGKTSLTLNIGYELSRKHFVLLADDGPQANLTEVIMKEERPNVTIYNALQPRVLGPAFGEVAKDIAFRVSQFAPSFAGGRGCYLVAGDAELT